MIHQILSVSHFWNDRVSYKKNQMKNCILGKRVTVVLDDEIFKKLREKQAKLIKESNDSVSFSYVVNEFAKKGIK